MNNEKAEIIKRMKQIKKQLIILRKKEEECKQILKCAGIKYENCSES